METMHFDDGFDLMAPPMPEPDTKPELQPDNKFVGTVVPGIGMIVALTMLGGILTVIFLAVK